MNELDLNMSRCLVEKQNFTYTAVTNVCNGEVYQVPHGAVDYLVGGLLGAFVVGICFVLVGLFIMIFRYQ